MVNRLMFLYFIQEKGFLNGDKDYLRNKLAESRDRKPDAYYRDFLCPLFFQGFARKKAERSAATNKLLGEIPYLNGGLFQKHQIEELHGKTIVIADTPLRNSSTSSRSTTGISTSVRTATATRSIRTCSATSSRSTSTRSKWARTTPKKTSPSTSPEHHHPLPLRRSPQGLCRGLCAERLGLASAPG